MLATAGKLRAHLLEKLMGRENIKLIFQTLRRKWEHTISWMALESEFFTEEMRKHMADATKVSPDAQEEELHKIVKRKEGKDCSCQTT